MRSIRHKWDPDPWPKASAKTLAKGIRRQQRRARCRIATVTTFRTSWAAVSQRQCSCMRRTKHCRDALFERTRVGQGCRLMKLRGYGAVSVVMADAWGEEATQHVRRGHIFGASCPSVAANICLGYGRCVKNISLTNTNATNGDVVFILSTNLLPLPIGLSSP